MKTMKFNISGQVTEACVHSGNMSLIQGNTIENSILHHIRESGDFTPQELENDLLPILPVLVGKRLLQKYAGEGKLIENGQSFHSPLNWNPEGGHLNLPEHSMLKVLYFEVGGETIVFGASLENDRPKPKRDETTAIEGSFSMPLIGRSGYSVFAENLRVFLENRIGNVAELLFDSQGARLVWENKIIKDFGSVSLKKLIAPNLDLEKNQTRVLVQNPFDDSFLKLESIDTLELAGMKLKLKLTQALRFKKLPLNERSATNAMMVLIRHKNPNTESYKAIVNHIWTYQAESWGFEKEALFPDGFPSYSTYLSIIGEN
jgi:hypothetical protein